MIVYPLQVDEGVSQYKNRPFWFLKDAVGSPVASTSNPERAEMFHEVAALTQQLVDGSEVEIEVLRRDKQVVSLSGIRETQPQEDGAMV